jgi:hypothetical protein
MNSSRFLLTGLVIATCCLSAAHLGAEEKEKTGISAPLSAEVLALRTELEALKQRHAAELAALQSKIDQLDERLDQARPGDSGSPAANQEVASSRGANTFNPDISVIADFLALRGTQGGRSDDDMLLREVELGFSGHVDTWGRYDLTVTFHNHPGLMIGEDGHDHAGEEAGHGGAAEVEEGYFTFLNLPGDLQARVGQFRNRVGKTNAYHPHSIAWTDYPLVIQRYLGEEGIIGTGVSASWLAPFEQFTELTWEFFKPHAHEEGSGLLDLEADGYGHLGRLGTVFDLSDSMTLELGGSSMVTPVDPLLGDEDNWLNGADVTFKWVPLGDGTFRRFEWRTELFNLRRTIGLERDHDDDDGEDTFTRMVARTLADEDDHAGEVVELSREDFFGWYSSLSYRFDRWWDLAVRYDAVEGPFEAGMKETAVSAWLTWWQSEYAYWRLGWLRSELEHDGAVDDAANRFFLQFNISLGPHPAHKY